MKNGVQRWALLSLGAVAGSLLGGGIVWAVDGRETIQACKDNRTGAVRLVSSSAECRSGRETSVSWNQRGLPGADGTNGADGVHCWDLNGNGAADSVEDVNGDGLVDVTDCRGADGTDGTDGAAAAIEVVDSQPGSTTTIEVPVYAPCNSDGSAGMCVIVYRSETVAATVTATALCPDSHLLLEGFGSGGGAPTIDRAVITEGRRTGWTYKATAGDGMTVTATAICLHLNVVPS